MARPVAAGKRRALGSEALALYSNLVHGVFTDNLITASAIDLHCAEYLLESA